VLDQLADEDHRQKIVTLMQATLIGALLKDLAAGLEAQGRPCGAEPVRRRALALVEASAGPEHQDVTACLDRLADTLHAQGRAGEAEALRKAPGDVHRE
jgi:hypothetical protein